MSELRSIQRRIRALVAAPEGVRAALEEEGVGARALDAIVRSDARLGAVERLEVYANAYFYRILGALQEDYEALARALGAASFNDVVTSYLLVHPPRHPSLRFAGDRLAGFIASHAAAEGVRARWPWAADLAALEWAMVDAFDAPDGETATREDFARIAPEDWPALQLRLDASVLRIDCAWPVHDLRRAFEALESEETPLAADLAAGASRILVWRQRERVFYRSLDPAEAAALDLAAQGASFGALCEDAARSLGEAEAPAAAAGWLAAWCDAGLLRRDALLGDS